MTSLIKKLAAAMAGAVFATGAFVDSEHHGFPGQGKTVTFTVPGPAK